jgi:OHS family lactose permease-like MFS transporter
MGYISTLIYTINPVYNFYVISLVSFLLLLVFLSLKTQVFADQETVVTTKKIIDMEQVKELFMARRFYVLMSFVIFTTVTLYIQVIQMGRFTFSFWDSKSEAMEVIGYLSVAASIIAFSVSIVSSKVINKIGASRSIIVLTIGIIAFFVIAGIAGYTHSKAGVIIARFTFNAINPLINVVILAYVAASFGKAVNGTAYLVGFHFVNNLGCTFFGPLIGEAFDIFGYAQGYFGLAAISFLGLFITMTLMSRTHSAEKQELIGA